MTESGGRDFPEYSIRSFYSVNIAAHKKQM